MGRYEAGGEQNYLAFGEKLHHQQGALYANVYNVIQIKNLVCVVLFRLFAFVTRS